jgi:ABC-type nitrate/sulfonate/bicarbonate transport system substrate-binding protein
MSENSNIVMEVEDVRYAMLDGRGLPEAFDHACTVIASTRMALQREAEAVRRLEAELKEIQARNESLHHQIKAHGIY